MATTLVDIHPHIIQNHILPRLDGPSLSTTATASSYLNSLCSDDTLWTHVSRSTWPSITHPRVDAVISTFPAGHRSFFDDSFPALITTVPHRSRRRSWSSPKSDCPSCHLDCSSLPSELISAVDIRYQNDVIYSTVKLTETTEEFLSSPFRIELTDVPTSNRSGSEQVHGFSRSIDLRVDEIVGADKATISHLKESLTLNWILIDPTRKRACNLSSVKPVKARADWATNETHVRYATVLPGCDPNEMVQCRIDVVLGVGEGGVGLKVMEVTLKLQDLDSCCLNGMEVLEITGAAIMEENNVRRKVVEKEQRRKSCEEFKEMKREKKEWMEKKERRRQVVGHLGFVAILMASLIPVYFVMIGS